MKRKFEALRENLDEFVVQNDYPVLAVGCLPEELAYVVKFLQALDEKHPAHFFLVFPQPFKTPADYMDRVAESLGAQLDIAAQARAARGAGPFPPMRGSVADRRLPPERRLVELLEYLRTLLPNELEYRVVVGFLPLECDAVDAYAHWLASIMPTQDFPAWMQALRIVVYDDRTKRCLGRELKARQVERVLSFDVDFSTPALTDALSVDAADPSLPVAERMGSLLQLAALDYAYKRYADAIAKYGILYSYYEGVGLPAMQAFCLLGAGDALRGSGETDAAKEMLQRGIALALANKSLAMLLNGLLSIVEVCFELGHFEDAESYADSGAKVAASVLNPFAYADLVERKGDAEGAQRKRAEALASYARSRELSKMYGHTRRSESVLGKLIRGYTEQGMGTEQREAEREFAQLQTAKVGEEKGAPGHGVRP